MRRYLILNWRRLTLGESSGNAGVMREWFAQLILYSQALTLAGEYAAFGELGGAVLQMVADTRRQPVSAENVLSVKQAIASMPAHPEVPEALRGLRDAGFRLFTLTNNPARTATEQAPRPASWISGFL